MVIGYEGDKGARAERLGGTRIGREEGSLNGQGTGTRPQGGYLALIKQIGASS